MGPSLQEQSSQPSSREKLVERLAQFIENEVTSKKGLKFIPLKTGLKMLKGLRDRALEKVVDQLLDDFIEALTPHLSPNSSAETTIDEAKQREIAEALLAVADRRVDKAKNTVIVKFYQKLRPLALEEVERSLPQLLQLLRR